MLSSSLKVVYVLRGAFVALYSVNHAPDPMNHVNPTPPCAMNPTHRSRRNPTLRVGGGARHRHTTKQGI